ncbi:MAG: hypothetical protein U1E39_04030 [Planctomycetota bacterium]
MRSGRFRLLLLGAALVGATALPSWAHNGEAPGGSAPSVPPTLGPPAAGPQDPQQPTAPVPRATTGGTDDAWRRWWEVQAPLLAPPRVRATTDGPLGEPGPTTPRVRTLDDAAGAEVLPLLLWAIEPRQDFPAQVVTACYRALGRLARRPEHVEPLLAAAARRDTDRDEIETAIGALGLLRRTDPRRRLDDATLARVRRALVTALDDQTLSTRARCVAATSLGLLADQGGPAVDVLARDLWSRLSANWASDEIPSAILLALGRFPYDAVGEDLLQSLRAAGVTGTIGKARLGPVARGHAVLAHARVCPSPGAASLLAILLSRRHPDPVRLGALTGLGLRAASFESGTRVDVVKRIRALVESEPSQSLFRPAGLLAVARLAAADLDAGSGAVLDTSGADTFLFDGLTAADLGMRPFVMVAIGIAGRRTPKVIEVRAYHTFRTEALERLRKLLADDAGAGDARGAYLVGLGLFADEASIPMLAARARDTSGTESPRAYACEALGLVGRAVPTAVDTLRTVASERKAEGFTRGKALAALSRLGTGADVVVAIADELSDGGAAWRLVPLADALGRCDHVAAVEPLVRLVRAKTTKDDLRAHACEALGRLCDPEPVPSLVRLAEGAAEMPGHDGLRYLMTWLWL